MQRSRILWITENPAAPLGWIPVPGWEDDVQSPTQAATALETPACSAIVVCLPVNSCPETVLLERTRRAAPGVPLLLFDPTASVERAMEFAHLGVQHIVRDVAAARAIVERAVEESRLSGLAHVADEIDRPDWQRMLVGKSREMRRLQHIIQLVADRRATVLVTGETGTGKELAARALHLAGCRRANPMVAVNCSALPETLLESELFGHVRGAFTGAFQNRTGRFEQAQGGTIFLDEIGELPLDLQTKLLRVLQEREVQRLGSSETIKLDVRVVAATNCDLSRRIEQGKFREDLYYRLNVVPLEMPPLRDRAEDVPLLATYFLERVCRTEALPLKHLPRVTVDRLMSYSWPGNVRQLANTVEMAVALSEERLLLTPSDFPLPLQDIPALTQAPVIFVPDCGLDYDRTLAGIERSILEQALRKTRGNKKAAADLLHLKRTTLAAKMRILDEAVAG